MVASNVARYLPNIAQVLKGLLESPKRCMTANLSHFLLRDRPLSVTASLWPLTTGRLAGLRSVGAALPYLQC